MRVSNFLIFMTMSFLVLSSGSSFGSEIKLKTWINGNQTMNIVPGKPAVIELKFLQPIVSEKQDDSESDAKNSNQNSGELLNELSPEVTEELEDTEYQTLDDFKNIAGKTMHLVMIKEDLSEFVHFHPVFDINSAQFLMPLHLPLNSPDNLDAEIAISSSGKYFVYAEVESKSMGLITKGTVLTATGEREEHREVVPSQREQDGSFDIYLDEQDQISAKGAPYLFRVKTEIVAGEGGDLWRFFITMTKKSKAGYQEVSKLSPWLKMGGHAILISKGGDVPSEKVFEHFHAPLPLEGGQLSFNHFARGGLQPGLYKIWFQLKYEDVVRKIPLVLKI